MLFFLNSTLVFLLLNIATGLHLAINPHIYTLMKAAFDAVLTHNYTPTVSQSILEPTVQLGCRNDGGSLPKMDVIPKYHIFVKKLLNLKVKCYVKPSVFY